MAAAPGDVVELEVVPHDSSKLITLGLADQNNPNSLEPDISVRRLMVPPTRVPYGIGNFPTGAATLTARRRAGLSRFHSFLAAGESAALLQEVPK